MTQDKTARRAALSEYRTARAELADATRAAVAAGGEETDRYQRANSRVAAAAQGVPWYRR